MVDAYQSGEPIPDGYVHIQLINPVNPWVDYEELRDLHSNYDLEAEHNVRYYFREMPNGWKKALHGISIRLEGQTITYPWTNIHSLNVVQNSEAYIEALHDYQLQHEHNWEPRTDPEGAYNFKYCSGCRVTDKTLEKILQKRVDQQRKIRP